jgi:hypothetical protein
MTQWKLYVAAGLLEVCVVREYSAKFGVHARKMTFNSQNEE